MKKITAILLSLFILQSCGQLSSLQTAKVLEKGEKTIVTAGFMYGLKEKDLSIDELDSPIFPHVEIGGRYGLGKSVDLGLKLASGLSVLLDAKFQVVGDRQSKFAAALGGGFEYQFTDTDQPLVYRAHLPIYLSIHPSENDGLYLVPRFIYQFEEDDDGSRFFGGGLGYRFQLSKSFSGAIELNMFDMGLDFINRLVYQVGIGGIYHF